MPLRLTLTLMASAVISRIKSTALMGADLADQLNDISGHLQGEIDGIDGADLADQFK